MPNRICLLCKLRDTSLNMPTVEARRLHPLMQLDKEGEDPVDDLLLHKLPLRHFCRYSRAPSQHHTFSWQMILLLNDAEELFQQIGMTFSILFSTKWSFGILTLIIIIIIMNIKDWTLRPVPSSISSQCFFTLPIVLLPCGL